MSIPNKTVLVIAVVVALVAGGALGYRALRNPDQQSATNSNQTADSTDSAVYTPVKKDVNLYFVKLNDNGKSGKKIGCNDSLVAVKQDIESTDIPGQTLIYLLLTPRKTGDGYHNALNGSSLTMQKYSLGSADPASLYLTGSFKPGGVCDQPRIEAQLSETMKQFVQPPTGSEPNLDIFINGKPLAAALSQK